MRGALNRLGQFITLEGSEGAGKSTNMDGICEHLTAAGIDFYRTREPGGTPYAEALRELMLTSWEESVDGLTELLTVFAARNQHIQNEIRPRLEAGQWVVCDRFTDASYAYQVGARGLPEHYLETLETWVQGDLRPDLTVYLDLDPKIGKARIADREQDRMEQEQLAFFEAVRAAYLRRAQSREAMYIVDASRSLADVRADIGDILQAFITQTQHD